jgi:hypothetical protein
MENVKMNLFRCCLIYLRGRLIILHRIDGCGSGYSTEPTDRSDLVHSISVYLFLGPSVLTASSSVINTLFFEEA